METKLHPKPLVLFWSVLSAFLYLSFVLVGWNSPNETIYAKLLFPLVVPFVFLFVPLFAWQHINIVNANEFVYFRPLFGTRSTSKLELKRISVGPELGISIVPFRNPLVLRASFSNGCDITMNSAFWDEETINQFADYLIADSKSEIFDTRSNSGSTKEMTA